MARAWAELMSRLGYGRYGAQGGDFGWPVSNEPAVLAADRIAGVHLSVPWAPLVAAGRPAHRRRRLTLLIGLTLT